MRKFIRVTAVLAVLAAAFGVSALAATATSPALVSNMTGTDTSTDATTATAVTTTDQAALLEQCNRGVVKYRSTTWHWQNLMGRHKTPSSYQPAQPHSLADCQWVINLWQQRATHWYSAAERWMRQRIRQYRRNVEHWQLVMGESSQSRPLAAGGSLVERFRRWRKTDQRVYQQWAHPPLLSDWLCIHHYEGAWDDPNAPYWGGLQMDYTFQQTYGPWLLKHKGTADHWSAYEQIWTALKAYRTRGFEPWPNTARLCGL